MATSNYQSARNTHMPHWKRLNNRGFEYVEVSDEGKVKNSQTGRLYTIQAGRNGAERMYVALTPSREVGGAQRYFAIDKLVFETFNNCVLPPKLLPEHKNGDMTDNRLVNLKIDARVMPASVPTVVNLPTIRPDAPAPAIVQKPPEVDRQAELAKRYEQRMEDLALKLMLCPEWKSVDDVLRIGILESEWVYLLTEYLNGEQVADVVLSLLRLLIEQGGAS